MVDRVRRPEQFSELMDELKKDNGVFKTLKDVMIFAACLGYKRDKRVPFSKSAEPISLHIFNGKYDATVIDSIAISVSDNDPKILADTMSDARILIFEEYACGGLEILKTEFVDGKVSVWEDALLSLIMGEESDNQILTDITGLASI